MKAIVLSCDRYIMLANHMIYTYQQLWPTNHFKFRVPYQDSYPDFLINRYPGKVELIKTESPIKSTALSLLHDIPDDEWIYWCMDDRYLIKISSIKEVDDLYRCVLDIKDKDVVSVAFHRNRDRFSANSRLNLRSKIVTDEGQSVFETVHTNMTKLPVVWSHHFIRTKVMRRLFQSFPDRPFTAKEMDFFKKEKLPGEKIYVLEKNLAVFGESTSRGKLTENCAASFKKWGLEIPENFQISKKYHIKGKLPYRLFGIEIKLPARVQRLMTTLVRWYWRNK
ncbi:MAG: hypothetical protein F6J95_025530 [Leptolyngbya sp. SIO1E4]|nr:hypothetical protein [Leptolyngbya sp. SIO1E4]